MVGCVFSLQPSPLFEKLEVEKINDLKARFSDQSAKKEEAVTSSASQDEIASLTAKVSEQVRETSTSTCAVKFDEIGNCV